MLFFKRIKTIRIFQKLIKQIEKEELDENKISELLNNLNHLKESKIITDDYIQDIEVLLYIIKKCFSISSGNWVQLSLQELKNRNSYNKMSDFIDEFDANSFIHHKIKALGGNISFELTHKDNFKKYVMLKMENKLEPLRFVKSNNPFKRTINFIFERLDQILIGVIIVIIGLILEKMFFM